MEKAKQFSSSEMRNDGPVGIATVSAIEGSEFHSAWGKKLFVRFEIFTAVTMKNGVFWDISFVFLRSRRRLLVTANFIPSSPILVTLMVEALRLCISS
jgi:hypothetical protein